MFLRVVGRRYVKRNNYLNLFAFIFTCLWVLAGYFTIKRKSYILTDIDAVKKHIIANKSMELYLNQETLNISKFIWDIEMECLQIKDHQTDEPIRDILLIINTFLGIEDDIYNGDSWWVIIFSLMGYFIFGTMIIKLCEWSDGFLSNMIDNKSVYTQLCTDDDQVKDFVLEYRKQKIVSEKTGAPIVIKSHHSDIYDIRKCYNKLADQYLMQKKQITPAFIYPTLYVISLFFLAAWHSWQIYPHKFVINLNEVSAYTTGLTTRMLGVNNDYLNYIFVIIGVICQFFLCATMWRISILIVELYFYFSGRDNSVRPVFVDSIREENVQNSQHTKNE